MTFIKINKQTLKCVGKQISNALQSIRMYHKDKTKVRNMCKIFSLIPSKNMTSEKTETNQVFTFQFSNDKIYSHTKKSHLALDNLSKLVFLVNCVIKKLKSKHLVCLSFLWWQVFWGNERKYLHIYRALMSNLKFKFWNLSTL